MHISKFAFFLLIATICHNVFGQSPGNVSSDLNLWFKANEGVEEGAGDAAEDGDPVLNWLDQSGLGNDAVQSTGSRQPLFDGANTINGYPVIQFNGSGHYLPISNINYANTTTLDEFTVYAIIRSSQTDEGIIVSYDRSSFFRFSINHNNSGALGLSTTKSGTTDDFESGNSLPADNGVVHFVGGDFDGVSSGEKRLLIDGTVTDETNIGTGFLGNSSELPRYGFIGTGSEATGFDGTATPANYFDGDIAEFIYYERKLTASERKQVESYLAIKFGITLNPDDDGNSTAFESPNGEGINEGDYVGSDGSVIWDASVNSAYHHGVAIIGRDDNSALDQAQSASINSDAILSMDKGSSFSSDLTFVSWGHNDASVNFSTSNTTTNYSHSLERIWKTQVTGSPGNVSITLDISGLKNTGDPGDYALLIDSDADFTSGATEHTVGTSINDDLITFTNVPLSSGDFFTIALELTGPANELENLQLWLRSDEEVYSDAGATILATPGDNVEVWRDQSVNDHAYIHDFGSNPTFESKENTDVLDFSGGSQYLRSGPIISGTTARTMFVVLRTNVLESTSTNNGAFALAPNASSGAGYTLFVEAPGSSTGLGLRVSGNKLMNYTTSLVSPTIFSTQSGLSANVTDSEIYANGLLLTDVVIETAATLNTSNLGSIIGGFSNGANNDPESASDFDGDIYEIIVFDDDISVLRREKINSYLAVKYGITKISSDDGSTALTDERDYFASDETVIWDWSANTGYNSLIAGVGRDDNSNFELTVGRSSEEGSIVSVDKGGSFSSDLDFLLWGNDQKTLSTITSNIPASLDERISRSWKVQANGSPGLVDVTFDLSAGIVNSGNTTDYALIIDSDGDFTLGATIINSGVTLVGDELTFSGVSLSNGDYFTLAAPAAKSPGGVADNLKLWLKADEGVTGTTQVSDWEDQSLNNFTASEGTPSDQPTFLESQINFNPTLQFDGSSKQLTITNGIFGSDSYSSTHAFIVAQTNTVQNSSIFYETTAGSTDPRYNVHLPWGDGVVYFDGGADCCTNNRLSVNWDGEAERPYLGTFFGSTTDNSSGNNQEILSNGSVIASDGTYNSWSGNNSDFYVGRNNLTNFYAGSIGEIVIYDEAVSDLDQQKIHSYLAIKYGFTLAQGTPQDYLASDGSVIFDATGDMNGFVNDIAGIGIDDVSGLHQKVSLSINENSFVKMAKPGGFPTDRTFIVWGNDGQDINATSTGVPAPYIERVNRLWRVDLTGNPGTADVSFILKNGIVADPDPGEYALLIDTDTDFSDATAHTTGATITGDTLTFTGVSFSDLDYFTLAVPTAPGPGGVSRNLKLWLRGDEGVVGGGAVQEWQDQSTFEYHSTQNNGTAQPDGITNTINNNSVITFDGSNHYFPVNASLFYDNSTSLDNLAIFSVFKTDYSGSENNNWAFLDFDRSEFFNFYILGTGELGLSYTGSGTSDIYGVTTLNDDQPHIGSGIYQNSLVNESILRYDGIEDLATDDVGTGMSIGTSLTRYGFIGDGSEADVYDGSRNGIFYDGQLGELIYYENTALNNEEIRRIESYLAIKYGVTLGGSTQEDYLASDASVIWDGTTNSSYHHDVAGIGRDDDSELEQTRSQSINVNSTVEIDKGGSFSEDLSFIIWGHDDATGSSTDVPSGFAKRLNRVWKVSVTGNPGTVNFTIDLNQFSDDMLVDLPASEYALLIDGDGTFFTSDTEHTTGASISSGILEFTDVSFTDADFFTIATTTDFNGPGGVYDALTLWMKADLGVENASANPATDGEEIAFWRDQSQTIYNGEQGDASQRPVLDESNTFNSNPVLNFSGSDNMPINALFYNSGNEIDAMTIYAVARTSESSEQILLSYDRSDYFRFALNHEISSDFGFSTYNGSLDDMETSNVYDAEDGSPHFVGGRFDGISTGVKELLIDGTISDTRNIGASPLGAGVTRFGFIGANSEATSFDGTNTPRMSNTDLAEIIYFEKALSSTERQRVESYMAMKYGIPLCNDTDGDGTPNEGNEGDWMASDETVFWDASENTDYNTDVIAIGRDNSSELLQKQSSTPDDSLRVYMATFSETNQDNPGSISSDLSFLAIGHNGGKQRGNTDEVPAGIYSKLIREWKITNTNFSDTYTIEIEWDSIENVDLDHLRLLVDDDGDFSDATIYGTADGLSFSFGSVVISGVNTSMIPMNSTRYFSMASVDELTPLPVEFYTFEAFVERESAVRLKWQTATEINNDYFTVLRSTDAKNWESLGNVNGAGNSKVMKSYSYLDESPLPGTSYYMIRQTDFDGTTSHSKIQSVNILSGQSFQIYPNPVENSLHVKFNQKNTINNWAVLNSLGLDMSQNVQIEKAKEDGHWVFHFKSLPKGLYFLQVEDQLYRILKD